VAWFTWLLSAGGVTGLATDLPLLVRVALCVLLATSGIHGVCVFVLLTGSRAIRAIEWNDAGGFFVLLGPLRERHPATLANGSCRLGARFWLLRFATHSGTRSVLVEEAGGDVRAFRRLSRRLGALFHGGSGRGDRPADTIPPKV